MSTEKEIRLKLAKGWSEIAPAETGYTLLFADDQQLIMDSTGFRHRHELGFIGGLNCPIAVDDVGKIAYRAATDEQSYREDDFENVQCEILAFDLKTWGRRVVAEFQKGLESYWLLTLLPDRRHLLTLLNNISDPESRRLATIETDSGNISETDIDGRAFSPQAIDTKNGRMLFSSGPTDALLLGFDGKAIAEIGCDDVGWISGASFLPDSDSVVVGENGLHIWDPTSGKLETVLSTGNHPVADEQGNIWFNSSGGSVARYDQHSAKADELFGLSDIDTSDAGFEQPVVFTADYKLGVARLTGRTPLSGAKLAEVKKFYSDSGHKFPESAKYDCIHCYCVFDKERKTVWKHPGYAHNVAWVTGQYYG